MMDKSGENGCICLRGQRKYTELNETITTNICGPHLSSGERGCRTHSVFDNESVLLTILTG